MHFQEAQKQAARTLRKANVGNSSSKTATKIHHMVAEYVRAFQSKGRPRRVAPNAPDKKGGQLAPVPASEGSTLVAPMHETTRG